MGVDRLTAEDLIMLWPDEIWPQDIGAIAVLDGAPLLDPDGRLRIEKVRDAVARRLHRIPRFRQLLYRPKAELGGPLWVDAPGFDVADHVCVIALPEPGDEAQLLLAVERLRRQRLDTSRPLWEMWCLTGLPEGQVGLFMRAHHCIADGIAGIAALGALLDLSPDAAADEAPPWKPEPAPTEAALLADHLRRQRAGRRRTLSLLVHPLGTARSALTAWPALRELFAEPALPATSLARVVGPDRSFALLRDRIEGVKEIAHAHGAKVNDVLLTAVAGGLGALLRSRGESVDQAVLRVYVPVTLRQGRFAGAQGNQIAQMVVPLPIGSADPGSRLEQIAAETTLRKARSHPSVGKFPHRGILGRTFLKLIDRQRVNVTTADLPGPPVPLYLAGARVIEMFPVLPLIGKVSLGVGAISYAGQFNITAVADRDGHPDLEVFAAGMRAELQALAATNHAAAVA